MYINWPNSIALSSFVFQKNTFCSYCLVKIIAIYTLFLGWKMVWKFCCLQKLTFCNSGSALLYFRSPWGRYIGFMNKYRILSPGSRNPYLQHSINSNFKLAETSSHCKFSTLSNIGHGLNIFHISKYMVEYISISSLLIVLHFAMYNKSVRMVVTWILIFGKFLWILISNPQLLHFFVLYFWACIIIVELQLLANFCGYLIQVRWSRQYPASVCTAMRAHLMKGPLTCWWESYWWWELWWSGTKDQDLTRGQLWGLTL